MSQCVVGLPDAMTEQRTHQERGNWHGGHYLGPGAQDGLTWDVLRLGQDFMFKPSHEGNR